MIHVMAHDSTYDSASAWIKNYHGYHTHIPSKLCALCVKRTRPRTYRSVQEHLHRINERYIRVISMQIGAKYNRVVAIGNYDSHWSECNTWVIVHDTPVYLHTQNRTIFNARCPVIMVRADIAIGALSILAQYLQSRGYHVLVQ
jgi:hypothetical protein